MRHRFAVPIIALLGLTTCMRPDTTGLGGPPDASYTDLLPILEVYSLQSFSGLETRRGVIINNPASLQRTWDSVFAKYDASQKPALPPIDFEHFVVLVASAGPTPAQLMWFRIMMVRERPEHVAVLVESHYPCGGTPVTTNPVHIVAVPRVATQAVFTFVDQTEPCS